MLAYLGTPLHTSTQNKVAGPQCVDLFEAHTLVGEEKKPQ